MACSRPDDKTLLYLTGRASPHPAIDFLKEARSLSQAALDAALIQACQFGFKYLVQKLVKLGADIECQDASGKTPLLICVENRYLDLVRFLVDKNADVQVEDYAGNNALILSISFAGLTEMTEFFLKQAGIKINHQNKDGYTAVMKALEVMDMGVVKLLLECYRYQHGDYWRSLDQIVNCKGETAQHIAEIYDVGNMFTLLKDSCYKHKSPLLAAVELCDIEIVSILLECQIKTKNDMTDSLIHIVRKHSEEASRFTKEEVVIIKKLLECGADIESYTVGYLMPNPVSIAIETEDYNLVKLLCQHGAPLNQQMNISEKVPLSVAAQNGRMDFIELLIKHKAEINTHIFINSPLDCALIYGHIDCANFLLNRGAKLEINLALTSAVDSQAPEYLQFLLKNFEHESIQYLLAESKNGNRLLVNAVQRGNEEIIEQILRVGVDINEPQRSGATPIVESKNGAIAMFLIQRGADVNGTDISNETPLINIMKKLTYTADFCIKEVVQVLLDNGACVNARTCDGLTPLMLAATADGHEAILQMLLDHGADYAESDNKGNTSLIHAIMAGCSKNHQEFLIRVMKSNPDLFNLQNIQGYTALMWCVFYSECSVMSELVDNGADVNITDLKGNTALHLAVAHFSISENHLNILIQAGCDVNHQNDDGLSPLMLAVDNYNYPPVSTLVDLGADINAVSHKDTSKTVISYFSNRFNLREGIPYLEALLDKGASASYLSPYYIFTIIIQYHHKLIPKLIRCGLAPVDVNAAEVPLHYSNCADLPLVSPLSLALLIGHVSLARYFWENLFLTDFDVSFLASHKFIKSFLQKPKYKDCFRFHAEIFSQPMSLFKLCFVAVTSAVGAYPGREERVNKLPLPRVIKDRLLFKSEVVSLNTPEDEDFQHTISSPWFGF